MAGRGWVPDAWWMTVSHTGIPTLHSTRSGGVEYARKHSVPLYRQSFQPIAPTTLERRLATHLIYDPDTKTEYQATEKEVNREG